MLGDDVPASEEPGAAPAIHGEFRFDESPRAKEGISLKEPALHTIHQDTAAAEVLASVADDPDIDVVVGRGPSHPLPLRRAVTNGDSEARGMAEDVVVDVDVAGVMSFFLRLRGSRLESDARDGSFIEGFARPDGIDLVDLQVMEFEAAQVPLACVLDQNAIGVHVCAPALGIPAKVANRKMTDLEMVLILDENGGQGRTRVGLRSVDERERALPVRSEANGRASHA